MSQTQNTKEPIALFSHTMTFPGVPVENLLSAVGMLMNAYGVKNDIPISSSFTAESLTTGDANANARFTTEYIQFKLMLEDMSRQYKTTQCSVQTNGTSVYMRFSCY